MPKPVAGEAQRWAEFWFLYAKAHHSGYELLASSCPSPATRSGHKKLGYCPHRPTNKTRTAPSKTPRMLLQSFLYAGSRQSAMTNATTIEVCIVMKDGPHQYYLLKVVRRGFDVYCIPPHLGVHYSVHESGKAHFRSEGKAGETGKEPPVVLVGGEGGTPIGEGIIRAPITDLGHASGICTACFPINSLSSDFQEFGRSAKQCFVVDKDLIPKDASWVEIGVWAVPQRNKVGFEFNNPNIHTDLLYKVAQAEPQIWIYARPFA